MTDRTHQILRYTLLAFLIGWGGYSFLYYLGVPVHQAVLLSSDAQGAVNAACPDNGMICRGFNGLFPFIQQTFTWAAPFMGYALLSLIAFAAIAGLGVLRTGQWRIRLNLSPAVLIGCFIASLWVIFTVIGASSNNGIPFSRIVEPTPQVYEGADVEALQALQDNFKQLEDAGCLTLVTNSNPRQYDMSGLCIQGSFFTRVLPHVALVLGLLLVILSLGRFLFGLVRITSRTGIVDLIFSMGLGVSGLIFILWLLALIGFYIDQPIYSMAAGWAILIAIPVIFYKHTLYWLQASYRTTWRYEGATYAGALIIGWLLISYLALNFLNVVRPFPIGWDDLGRYINVPRLLISYGYMVPQLGVYQWEYITSLGFMLFGYESVFGATVAMMFNWTAGLLAVIVTYAFGRIFLGRNHGLLAALLYYTLPLVGHFSFADMKVDNAVYFMGVLTLLAIFMAIFPAAGKDDEEEHEPRHTFDWRWMILAGIFAGVAFSFKPTAIMTIMAVGTVMFGARVHWTAFVGTMFLAWALFTLQGQFNLPAIATRVYGDPGALSKTVILGAFLVLGAGLTAYAAYIRPKKMKDISIKAGIFIVATAVTILPWLITNNISYGNVIPRLVFTPANRLTPSMLVSGEEGVDYGQDIRSLPADLQVDQTKCGSTAKTEELDRYWGYGSGWSHYIKLPWRTVMNLDSAGYYVTTFAALLLFPSLLLLPYFWTRKGAWLRWLFIGTIFMLVQWMFFANGIPWYGLGTFFGLVIGLEALIYRAPDTATKTVGSILIALSLITAFSNRFWQHNQQQNLFEYPIGKVTYETMRERTIPYYDDIREMIEARAVEMPERPYVYRIGTFIPYFIPKNLETLPVADHQLDFFNCLHQERNGELTVKRLQALGFNSIIFDTNTHTIERDPNGSLHQKVQMFVDFANTPGLGLQVIVNDTNAGIAYILLP